MTQLSLDWSRAQGDLGMRRAASSADRRMPDFSRRAGDYMLALLVARGPMPGEDLTDACIAAGFDPGDARAFGMAFRYILAHGARVTGYCARRKGHGSSGGKVYGIEGAG